MPRLTLDDHTPRPFGAFLLFAASAGVGIAAVAMLLLPYLPATP